MKRLILLSITIPIFLFPKLSNSQQYYVEQNSGVNVNLTSACICKYPSYPSQVWVCGFGGTVLKTTNSGSNWINTSTGLIPANINLTNISVFARDTVLTIGQMTGSSNVYRTVNGGANWNLVFTQAGNLRSVWMKNGVNAFMVGDPVGGRWSLWKTTNAGLNWDSTGLNLPQNGTETGFNNSLVIVNDTIWFGTNNSRIYKSTNYGTNWSFISTSPEVNSSMLWIPQNIMYGSINYKVIGGNNIYYSTNQGANWLQATCPGSGMFTGFAGGLVGSDYFALGPGYAVRGDSSIYAGNEFPNLIRDYSAPSGRYNHLAYDYIGNNVSWAVRTNGGITMVTIFRGGAVHSISSEIPKSYNLEQNYPNPFNPATKIRFDLKKEAFTNIKVYDVLGREVAVIVNEQLHPGVYEADFDASSLSSGIYYYRISARQVGSSTGDYSEVKKMAVVK